MGKPSVEPIIETERKKNDLRSSTRQLSKVIRSCQSCDPEQNLKILNCHISQLEISKSSITEAQVNHLRGLRAVLQMLLASYSFEDGRDVRLSYMKLTDAFSLFLAYQPSSNQMSVKAKERKDHFKYLVFHPKFGLSVYIVKEEYLLLRPKDIGLELFLEEFIQNKERETEQSVRLDLTNDLVQEILCTVDSEWDKKIIRVLLGATRSRAELEKLGIKSDNIAKDQEYVKETLKEHLRAKTAAEDIIKL